jgi:DNA-binding transcriptional LysR family regulator
MELRHLRYFVAVAEMENVSRAALKLHVSQPALSRQIRDLEGELGVALLERSAKSVRLTDVGRAFLAEARTVLKRAEDAVNVARAVAGQGELHVGYAPSLTPRLLPATLRAFQTAAPGVRAKLHDLSSDEMIAGLHDGKLQIAFGARPAPALLRGLRFVELTRDAFRLAVAPKHRLAKKCVVTVADAAREPFVAYSRADYLDAHNHLTQVFPEAKIVEEHDGVASLMAAVEAGRGVALVVQSLACLAGPRLKLLPITPSPGPVLVGAVLPKSGGAASAEKFLECARQISETGA